MSFTKYISEFLSIASEVGLRGSLWYFAFRSDLRWLSKIYSNIKLKGPKLAILGAGTYTASININIAIKSGFKPTAVSSGGSRSGYALKRHMGLAKVYDDESTMICEEQFDALLIASPHFLHPRHLLEGVQKEKYIYCEKPVAIDKNGVSLLFSNKVIKKHTNKIFVGFNRRFAPSVVRLMEEPWIGKSNLLFISYSVNFGAHVANRLSDITDGGGRLIGTCCHYVDLISFIAGSPITWVFADKIEDFNDEVVNTFHCILGLENGGTATLSFSSEGNRDFGSKEEITISSGGNLAKIVDFKRLKINGLNYRFTNKTYGSSGAWLSFNKALVTNGDVSINLSDGLVATAITLAIRESTEKNQVVELKSFWEGM